MEHILGDIFILPRRKANGRRSRFSFFARAARIIPSVGTRDFFAR